MYRTCKLLAVALTVLMAERLDAAPKKFDDVAKVSVSVEPAEAKRGQTVTWKITIELIPGYHTYPTIQTDPKAEDVVNKISFPKPGDIVPVGKLRQPSYLSKPDPKIEVKELHFYEGTVTLEQSFVIRPDATPGKAGIKSKLKIQACDDSGCLTKNLTPDTPLTITEAPAVDVDPKYADEVKKAALVPANPVPVKPPDNPPNKPENKATPSPTAEGVGPFSETSEEYRRGLETVEKQLQVANVPKPPSDLWTFILSGIFWGAVSLVTPCVFPMIPITVSFFLKQSEKEHHRPLTMALVYCLTIVVVLTLSAILLLSFFRWLSVNPITNIVLGGLFVFFALSLFGMYEIELPNFMARYTSAREGQGGLAGTMFMALTFTIVSFACVAPFLGGFGGTSATSTMTWEQRVFGGLAFSVTFASPFFILALFPTLLKKMPKSGSWLNSVKVVMAFLELAAALKFLRAAEVVRPTPPAFFTYDVVLGLYIALSILCGLYLLGVYRLPHDTPSEHLGVPRLVLSALFLGLGIYLIPALFPGHDGDKHRPSGAIYAWIDSFLLPDDAKGLDWGGDLNQAVAEARKQQKDTGKHSLIFVDFTGKSCTNCKYNEGAVFSRGDVKDQLKHYKRVQLYTDIVPLELYPAVLHDRIHADPDRQDADAQANLWFQKKVFDDERLPLYVILDPQPEEIKVVGVYKEGKINDVSGFSEFLRKPLVVKKDNLQAKAD